MVQTTKDTEFIIGIDFGHGETSAAFYSLKTQDKFDLDILPGKKVIKSALAILEQEGRETICVGDAAIQKAPYAKDFQISFKKRPSEMTAIERNRMVAFMKGVYAEILNRHADYKTRKHVVYIARPSQDKLWKSEESEYIKIAEDAGIPVAGIQKESRAAYFRARTQPDSKIDKYVKDGILIVDFGSSTIDFTYLNSHLSKPIDDGCDLGASEVERLLFEYAMSNPTDPHMPEFARLYGKRKDSNPYNQMLFKFRKAKEDFYENKLSRFSIQFDYGDLTSSEESSIFGFGGLVIPSRDKMNEILGEGISNGYIERIKGVVKKFKDEKLKDNKVACVYLTGGASRMDFVRRIFMDVFSLDESHCQADETPSVIVSQGVAHLSYADIVAKEKEQELKNIAQRAISQYRWNENIQQIVRRSIKAKIIDKAWSIMISYKSGDIGEYMTLKDNKNSSGEYIGREGESNGYLKVRNIRSLRKEFRDEFNRLVHYDFAKECEDSITKDILDSVVRELKVTLKAFEYTPSSSNILKINGLSASITSSGAEQLSDKFTEEGDGHIIYDAVSSCYPMMVGWNLYKDRWESDREQHYDYYRKNYANIFSEYVWNDFLNNRINISGIDSARNQTQNYLSNLVNDYVSYAKLAIFFK